MVLKGLTEFSARKKSYAQKLTQFGDLPELSDSDHEKIQDILCEFMMDPKSTDDVADCFPRLLPALVSASISICTVPSSYGYALHRLNCVILGKLVHRNHDLLGFALHYFDANQAPFELSETTSSPSPKRRNRRKIPSPAEVSDYDIVRACYNFLSIAPAHFKYKWNWSKFYQFLTVDNAEIKWLAMKCVGIVLGMSEASRLKHASAFLSDVEQSKFLTELIEDTEINVVSTDTEDTAQTSNNQSVVSIGGILLPTFNKRTLKNEFDLIPVPSTHRNLRNLALAVSSNKCVCLQGAVGSGKTTLVEFLAQATGHSLENFSKVQLGDQTDSKMLLGMYRCTDIPGEFLWQPGILTEAVANGKWLLLEDIDCAATDVASVVGHLVETKTLSVPGYKDSIRAKSGFQLFVTRRLASGSPKALQVSASLQKHWSCVNVEPLSKDELVTVVQSLFPVLNTVATRIVDVFLLFSVGNHEDDTTNYMRNGRQTSTRDLIKWCSRAVTDFDVSSPDSALKIFQDALDVFCCSVPDCVQRLNLAIAVAHKLGIIKTKAEYFCTVHKPSFNFRPEALIIGRSKLHRKKSEQAKLQSRKLNFSYTRPSMCLLERITSCVAQREPVLLVGETGTGKTSCVQYLAQVTGHKLIVINMNQQSESADLLGGYKPVDLRFLISPIREEFEVLFRSYFAVEPNRKFLEHVGHCCEDRKWKTLASLMIHSTGAAIKRLRASKGQEVAESLMKWEKLAQKLEKLQSQVRSSFSLAFSFVEGSLVKALKNGDWVLLDEINLASSETLECLSGLLESSCGSLSLLERGDKEPIKRHPDFAIFACMNPATDVGKKDLPTGLRNRFTEFFVDELTEKTDLQLLVKSYLEDLNLPPEKIDSIVKFYLNVRKEAENTLLDGTGHKPHYSLRTLCRALSVSAQNPCGNILRSLYEAFSLSFLTQLDSNSHPLVRKMIAKALLDDKIGKAVLGSQIPRPRHGLDEHFVCFEGYWIPKGDLEPRVPENYILTETVRRNLKDLVRVVSIGKMPVLLQGDTSVGKTSLITYLAKASGHACVRINNHEHTDLQEYIGTYVADSSGRLVFKEGALVDAMRRGHWIILDELNLAPSDVLEALNRVLDDNRELFIPETQQVVKAHNNFMLFATQNPPGLYGGRKVLSRAFRNRFVELHFDEIPAKELQIILQKRCKMPESYCKQVINVMTDLQVRRKSTATFAGKKGFITLRDLFRWAERYHLAPDTGSDLYDWSQHLADEGYLVLSSKVRHAEECSEILQVLKKHLRRDVDPEALFSLSEKTSPVTRPILESLLSQKIPGFEHVVWTFPMRKIAVLLRKACDFKEPVLLIGETGGGKTTVCQLLSVLRQQQLSAVNCHMHTEASDFLGSLRPVREREEDQKLFEWVDGPLVKAMKTGGFFLADEISLADDSVLERLNSLLEPERKLLVAEKPSEEDDSTIVADDSFIFVGTMNPGGDYGKKELSPALRNRFTEIWCEGCVSSEDLRAIMFHNLREELKTSVSTAMLEFLEWLKATEIGRKLVVSVRDVLTWVDFVNRCQGLEIGDAFLHGASLSYIDGLGSGLTASEDCRKLKDFKESAFKFIKDQVENTLRSKLTASGQNSELEDLNDKFGIHPFYVEKGSAEIRAVDFAFASPTTKVNTLKLLRALQLKKPILLEGSPGVGKTSLVSALARASGHPLLRLNLSDQTDISDLFGADLPVEGGKPGEFSWRDGPFLRALKSGHWILLDELNLASQSVLEGLNACLDHRGEIYVPELGKTFYVKPGTRLFGCQNPLRQGGARRGLPKSFLNRFTQVFVDALEENDLKFILNSQFPDLPEQLLAKMILFNEKLNAEVGVSWAHSGSPWEMNLRDVTRWCQITEAAFKSGSGNWYNPGVGAELIYVHRMRTQEDRERVREIYENIFSSDYPLPEAEFPIHLTREEVFLGDEILDRSDTVLYDDVELLLLREQKTVLRDLARCVNRKWMAILIGGSGSGKTSLVRLLANLAGQKLKSIAVNSAMDTTEILGGFEQTDYNRHFEELSTRTETLLIEILRRKLSKENLEEVSRYHGLLENVRRLSEEDSKTRATMSSETNLFLNKTEELLKLVSAMKTFDGSCEVELRDIENRLADLSIAVEKDKCLNAGGKFEWVDSVLVKCLQNGTWLLLDQVNVCSPAILDRLNGLLEPNGALTIGEKGVDNCGNVFTVRPHENFRLFLAMDPRYGEISRAMRNRGVEISILEPNKISDYNRLDLKSLLNNCGIRNASQQNVLLKVHENLSNDKFGTIELLQAAAFTSRQVVKGFTFESSLRNSCREIYAVFDSRLRKEALRTIDDILLEYVQEEGSLSLDLNAITVRICDLQNNARLTLIRQQGFLMKTVAEALQSSETIDFQDLFGQEAVVKNPQKFLEHLLLDFYERSSMDDLKIRRTWSSQIFTSNDFQIFQKFNQSLSSELESFTFQNSKLPVNFGENLTTFNHLAITLYFKIIVVALLEDRSQNKDIMSLEEYSDAVCSGKVSSHLKNEPLITNFAKLIKQSRKTIDAVLRDKNFSLIDERYLELRENIKWYQRFHELGRIELIDRSRGSFIDLRQTSSTLNVHYKWLLKFVRKFLLPFEPELGETATRELSNFSEISSKVQIDGDRFRKIRKRARKFLLTPTPHFSEESMRFHENLRKASRKFELTDEDLVAFSKIRTKILFLRTAENLTLRGKLIDVFRGIFRGDEAKIDDLLEIEGRSKDANEKEKENSSEIEIWPIYEGFFFIFAGHFQRKICESFDDLSNRFSETSNDDFSKRICEKSNGDFSGKIDGNFGKICEENVVQKFGEVATIPARLIGSMKVLNVEEISCNQRIFLLLELFFLLEQFTERSFASNNAGILLNWSNSMEEEEVEENFNFSEQPFVNKSTLLNLFFELLSTKSKTKKDPINLGNYKEQKNQLKILQSLLWKNSSSLNSDDFDPSKNDAIILQFYIDYYLSAIERATSIESLTEQEKSELENRFSEPARKIRKIQENLKIRENPIERGKAWLLLGHLQIFLFHDLGFIDPVRKIGLKARYLRENIADLENSLLAEKLQCRLLGISTKTSHLLRIDRLIKLTADSKTFENFQPVRSSASFHSLREELENFSRTVGSFEAISRQAERLAVLALGENPTGDQEKIREAVIWKKSIERFSGKLEKNFLVGFPDLTFPIVVAISSLRHGVSVLLEEIANAESRKPAKKISRNLLRFPALGDGQENYLSLVKSCFEEKTIFLLAGELKSMPVSRARFELAKIALREVENLYFSAGALSRPLFTEMLGIFRKIRGLWVEQERKREEKSKEEESLFKMKSEEVQDELDFRRMFPGSKEDFAELQEIFPGLQTDAEFQVDDEVPVQLISSVDAMEIQEIHFNILNRTKKSGKISANNFVDPLLQRFELFGSSIKSWPQDLSSDLTSSLNVLISRKLEIGRQDDRKLYDFYKDPNVPEVEECQPLFKALLDKIDEFLKQWPENPLLNSIKLIVDRILGFSIDSSLSRFLTGVELLSSKIQQWEENARCDVSLAEFIEFFGGRVLRWRKIEISRWKDSLEVLERRLQTEASKWWFFLFDLVDEYLQGAEEPGHEMADVEEKMADESGISKEKLVENLERFLAESSLIEFETRLRLILLFYQHVDHLENRRKSELSAILWNVHSYYKQFSADVENKIKALKEPIAKKLKDTIKITRWNDLNYWSVKNTAEKAQRALHKLVKEFQKGLQQNAASYLVLKPKKEIVEKRGRREITSSNFLINFDDRSKMADKLTRKARNFCEQIISRSRYSQIRGDVEDFIEEMMEEGQKLRDLEIDRTLTKAKRQTQWKSILQRKKMALANYFKTLTQLGVSYRLGILTWKNRKSEIVDFATTPVHLVDLQRFTGSKVNPGLLEEWAGCEKYYYGSLIKFNSLDAILASAKSDLGVQNIERLRGFSVHLVSMAHRQKKTLGAFFEHFLPLSIQVSNMAAMTDDSIKMAEGSGGNFEIPRQSELQEATEAFQELLTTLEIGVRQVVIFLESCPAESVEGALDLSEIKVAILQESEISKDFSHKLKEELKLVHNMAEEVNKWRGFSDRVRRAGHIFFLHWRHFGFLRARLENVEEVKGKLIDLKDKFPSEHPIVASLDFLINKINDWSRSFKSVKSAIAEAEESEDVADYRKKLDSLVKQVLLAIQEKVRGGGCEEKEEKDVEVIDVEVDFEENALTEKLIGSLRKDVSELRLKTVFRMLGELLGIIYKLDSKSANYCVSLLLQHMPLLEQYTLFLHFYLYEQVASFRLSCKFLYLQLNVFLDLAANGFCKPQDLDPSSDDEGNCEAEGGMGLADGEGQKDVSDRIETEDQLEEAKRPNDEKEENEKKDTKEEEKGIDMSEDFESHLQDLEKGEDEEDEGDDDLDKEMGETEENADKLDEEMWKDEEEEEENGEENKESGKEETGKGEETGTEELTAKEGEDPNKKEEEKEQQEGGEREEQNKEINEFEEPETNEDHVNPYHGNHQPEPEPEPFDLPEDVDLDDEMKEDDGQEEENPFDIDQMKESKLPEEKEGEEEPEAQPEVQPEAEQQDSSDEEEETNPADADSKKEKAKGVEEEEQDPEEQNKEDEEKENEKDKVQASIDDGSKEVDASEDVDSRKDGSRDAVEAQTNDEKEDKDSIEKNADDSKDKGTGQSQTEERTGHSGSTKEENVPTSGQEKDQKPIERRRKPGESNEDRSLLDNEEEPRAKKLKTAPTQEELNDDADTNRPEQNGENDTYEHIKKTEKFDDFALDAATEEQVKKQASNFEQDEEEKMDETEDDAIAMADDEPTKEDEEDLQKQSSEKTADRKKEKPAKSSTEKSNETEQLKVGGEIEGETAETTRVLRGNDSTFHTILPEPEIDVFPVDREEKRFEIEKMLSEWSRAPSSTEAATAWSSISALTESPARELSEKLRLVLEPTLTSRLKGDYRTGRRLNMRKIIPYIASEFRKDKIWLRRTKPSKRDYQVVLAIDNSSSMADNHSKELAFESLSLIGKAMTYLEVGQLAVLSFGECVNILHPLGENFTDESGARLIQEMKFEQKKTKVGELLNFTVEMLETHGGFSENPKLVAVLSDGRGIFSEGTENVSAAVRKAKLANIFLVFIIIDNPINKDSILDIRMPVFENGKLLGIRSYMDSFPFPFYIILRDLSTLPGVLSDALRQWFEIVGRIDT